MRQIAKVDRNQAQIVGELRDLDFSVLIMSQLGNGAPDILVGKYGISLPVEIKYPGEKMTPAEEKWFGNWHGSGIIAETTEEITGEFIRLLRKKNERN